jgi:hypothetical protein
MEDKEMAENLWELANLVAGFSVAQSLATLFAVVRGDLNKMFDDRRSHCLSLIGIASSTALYALSVVYCGYEGERLDGGHLDIWLISTVGRLFVIFLFSGIFGAVVWRHWQLLRRTRTPGSHRDIGRKNKFSG